MDISINNLSINFPNTVIFDNFTANFRENKITCILGESGIGKTTLLNAIANNVTYTGTINKQGNISFIFQDDRLIPNITVYKNLELVIKNNIKDKIKREKLINKILNIVELEEKSNNFPTELSGGMKSRISMARGFLYPAQILLMDETFRGLDTALKSRLINAFYSLYCNNKRTVIFVTHSIDEALLLADDIIVLNEKPAKICYKTTINIPQNERKLSCDNLDSIRKELLNVLVK